jgi:regulator of protease activity HflC (stomatin/prohibitin superfamily)
MASTLRLIGAAFIGLFLIVGLAVVGTAFTTVDEGQAAVETNWGEYTGNTYQSGGHWIGDGLIPNGVTHSVQMLNTEAQTMELSVTDGLSQDGQDIDATVSVTYSLDGQQAGSFYSDSEQSEPFRSVGIWESRIGERAVVSAVQDATSSVSTREMVQDIESGEGDSNINTLRSEIQVEVENQLREETNANSPEIKIQSVRIEKVTLSNQLSSSLESIATENAEAERKLIEARGEAEAQRERAQGEADAFNTVVEAYGSEEKALQSEWIEAINEDEGTIVLDAEAAPILDLNNNQVTTDDSSNEDENSSG